MEKIAKMQIDPGASAFRNVERYARQQGFAQMGKANGDIELARAGDKRQSGALVEGKNIIDGEATHSHKGRFSEYHVFGQSRKGVKKDDLRHMAIVRDPGVTAHRVKKILFEGDATKARCKRRAEAEKNRRAGEGAKGRIVTQGFRDGGGKLFAPGALNYVASKALKLDQDMMIESVQWEQGVEGGSLASLDIVDPRAHGGKKPGTVKSGKAWTAGLDDKPVAIDSSVEEIVRMRRALAEGD